MWPCSVSIAVTFHMETFHAISCTGDNGTVVYLEEVPIQSLPAIKGAYTYLHNLRICIPTSSFNVDRYVALRISQYLYIYACKCSDQSRDDRS